ncbi:MAG: 5-formyltetrahydrofolate cyclo-ligase [Clostridia bacterium]|nr:5-formyltetrahydrofolate cyclo-ligase [Clostridia bacterium]
MYEIRKHKTEIREYYLAKRRGLEDAERAEKNEKICKNMLGSATFRYADIILMYYPKPDEIDIRPVAEAALAAGKKIAFPRCNPADHTMVFHYVSSLDELLPGSYNLMEPAESLPAFTPELAEKCNVACIVPAVVFDKKGFRIGYGGGYYDRYLAGFRGTKVGFAYRDFIVNSVPHGRFDLTVDVMITERGLYAKS